ncbi:hypothetical protein EDD16DRAFT_72936 [Pisolithus croceorrhizus]|nr:hypothetical protein EDD16DRAFT_72936 [Pisolithus croceorrhizus]
MFSFCEGGCKSFAMGFHLDLNLLSCISQDVSSSYYSVSFITTDMLSAAFGLCPCIFVSLSHFARCYLLQVPTISHAAFALTMPTLSTSKTYSMQYIAEHGIGSILVFEYLYFLLQARSVESILQEHLNLAVETYQNAW